MGGCYKSFIKEHGIKKGAKLWKEGGKKRWEEKKKGNPEEKLRKSKTIKTDVALEAVVPVVSKPKEDLEPLQKIVLGGPIDDVRKNREDILECGSAMIELIKTPAWYKWLKPQILNDAVDFIRKTLMLSGEKRDESAGGYNYTKKLLKTVDRWIADYTYIIREIEKEAIKKKQREGGE